MPDTPPELSLQDVITRFRSSAQLADDYTKGDAALDVVGADGTYPSLAKLTSIAQQKLRLLQAFIVQNVSNDDMVLGQPVYATGELTVDFANAASTNKKIVIGLVADNLILSQSGIGNVLSTGTLVGTVTQWEVATGMVGGLVTNAEYFLDTIAGRITPFAPTDDGTFLCPVGRALSTTVFSIRIERPIAL